MTSVLFVCLGNICRSPAAEGFLRHLAVKNPQLNLRISSCGLGSWHEGNLPDIRMQEASMRRGVILSSRAKQFYPEFFDNFDYIFAADNKVLEALYHLARESKDKAKVHLITAFSKTYRNQEIPDPYHGGEAGFEHVLDILEDSCEGLIEHLKNCELSK